MGNVQNTYKCVQTLGNVIFVTQKLISLPDSLQSEHKAKSDYCLSCIHGLWKQQHPEVMFSAVKINMKGNEKERESTYKKHKNKKNNRLKKIFLSWFKSKN